MSQASRPIQPVLAMRKRSDERHTTGRGQQPAQRRDPRREGGRVRFARRHVDLHVAVPRYFDVERIHRILIVVTATIGIPQAIIYEAGISFLDISTGEFLVAQGDMGYLGVLNPFSIWLMVVLIVGIVVVAAVIARAP